MIRAILLFFIAINAINYSIKNIAQFQKALLLYGIKLNMLFSELLHISLPIENINRHFYWLYIFEPEEKSLKHFIRLKRSITSIIDAFVFGTYTVNETLELKKWKGY